MITIRQLTTLDAMQHAPALAALLRDAVEDGASVGYVLPLPEETVARYWTGVIASVANGDRLLLAAFDGEQLAGSIQLALVGKPNGRHRADVEKLLVFTHMRQRGIGKALLAAVEEAAQARGRSLLVLDTKRGDPAEQLYRKYGYTVAGVIPRFAISVDGAELDDTVVFYRELTA